MDISKCDFLIDYSTDVNTPYTLNVQEPNYVADKMNWEVVECLPFLNAAASRGIIGRVLYVPFPGFDEGVWGDYCLLKRKSYVM